MEYYFIINLNQSRRCPEIPEAEQILEKYNVANWNEITSYLDQHDCSREGNQHEIIIYSSDFKVCLRIKRHLGLVLGRNWNLASEQMAKYAPIYRLNKPHMSEIFEKVQFHKTLGTQINQDLRRETQDSNLQYSRISSANRKKLDIRAQSRTFKTIARRNSIDYKINTRGSGHIGHDIYESLNPFAPTLETRTIHNQELKIKNPQDQEATKKIASETRTNHLEDIPVNTEITLDAEIVRISFIQDEEITKCLRTLIHVDSSIMQYKQTMNSPEKQEFEIVFFDSKLANIFLSRVQTFPDKLWNFNYNQLHITRSASQILENIKNIIEQ